jgi:hypothetical protein
MVSREDKNRTAGHESACARQQARGHALQDACGLAAANHSDKDEAAIGSEELAGDPASARVRKGPIHDDKPRGTPRRPNGSGSARPSPRFHRQYSDEKLSGGCERMDDPVHRAHGRKVLETSHRAWRHEPREDFPSQCGPEDRIPAENYDRARAMSGS